MMPLVQKIKETVHEKRLLHGEKILFTSGMFDPFVRRADFVEPEYTGTMTLANGITGCMTFHIRFQKPDDMKPEVDTIVARSQDDYGIASVCGSMTSGLVRTFEFTRTYIGKSGAGERQTLRGNINDNAMKGTIYHLSGSSSPPIGTFRLVRDRPDLYTKRLLAEMYFKNVTREKLN
jgi:hypothetical protein